VTASFGQFLSFKDKTNGIKVEMSLNKTVEVYNSHLIMHYALQD